MNVFPTMREHAIAFALDLVMAGPLQRESDGEWRLMLTAAQRDAAKFLAQQGLAELHRAKDWVRVKTAA